MEVGLNGGIIYHGEETKKCGGHKTFDIQSFFITLSKHNKCKQKSRKVDCPNFQTTKVGKSENTNNKLCS